MNNTSSPIKNATSTFASQQTPKTLLFIGAGIPDSSVHAFLAVFYKETQRLEFAPNNSPYTEPKANPKARAGKGASTVESMDKSALPTLDDEQRTKPQTALTNKRAEYQEGQREEDIDMKMELVEREKTANDLSQALKLEDRTLILDLGMRMIQEGRRGRWGGIVELRENMVKIREEMVASMLREKKEK
ncbi:hypothetical protein BDZ45DRAFT_740565 [Acephala macrosclerotiorum]|nr:hypothetical protein BDZ45DRAFT_740565 [Acephala macrosclerotiorum]